MTLKILIFRFIPIESSFLHLLIFILNFCHIMYYVTTTKFLTEYSIMYFYFKWKLYSKLWEFMRISAEAQIDFSKQQQ